MFIPPYRFINFEHCLFHPTGLLFWGLFQHTYMFIPPYRFINFDEFFPHTYLHDWPVPADRDIHIVTTNALSKINLVQYKSFWTGPIDFGWVQIFFEQVQIIKVSPEKRLQKTGKIWVSFCNIIRVKSWPLSQKNQNLVFSPFHVYSVIKYLT